MGFMPRTETTQKRLKELFRYSPSTGLVKYRPVIAGSTNGIYVQIRVDGVYYSAGRLAYLWMTGTWPPCDIDHKNGKKKDNRWSNLRLAPGSINQQNLRAARKDSVLGLLGVKKEGKRFSARIQLNGVRRYLGSFESAAGAYRAYLKEKRRIHPGFTSLK